MSATVFFDSANELATLSNTFKVNGSPTDPTVTTLTVTSPTNVTTTYSGGQLTHGSTGVFSKDVTCDEAGTWTYQWDGTTAASDAVVGTWEVFETQLGRLYCTVEALKSRLGIPVTDTTDDLELHAACFTASRALEQFCERHFWRSASSEVRTFVPDDWYCLSLPEFCDLVSVTTLKTDASGDGVFETTWTAADYQLLPQNPTAGPETRPYTKVKAVGSQIFPVTYATSIGRDDTVQVTGVFGWPAVPWAVKMAARVLAQDAFKLKDSNFGQAGEGDFAIRVGENARAEKLAKPYRRNVVLMR